MEHTPPRHWALRPTAKPFTRWTGDTEQAFLLALRLTGNVRKAAETIGRSLAGAYQRRQRDPEFAARWDAAVAELQAEWIAGQGKLRKLAPDPLAGQIQRRGGWNAARRKLFLRVLSETGSVADAAGRARISTTSAYELRQKSAAFAGDWEAALDTAAVSLEQAAFERAVEGWEEPIVQGGQVVGHRRRYSDLLLRTLLAQSRAATAVRTGRDARKDREKLVRAAHEAARAAGGGFYTDATAEETNAAILKKIDAIERHRKREAEAARTIEHDPGGARPRVR